MKTYMWAFALGLVAFFLYLLTAPFLSELWILFGFSLIAGLSIGYMGPELRLERFIINSAFSSLIYGLVIVCLNAIWLNGLAKTPFDARFFLEMAFVHFFCFFIATLIAYVIRGFASISHKNRKTTLPNRKKASAI